MTTDNTVSFLYLFPETHISYEDDVGVIVNVLVVELNDMTESVKFKCF